MKATSNRSTLPLRLAFAGKRLGTQFHAQHDLTVYHGDCCDFLAQIPAHAAQLIITSPPYNIGKEGKKSAGKAGFIRVRLQ
jgi:tRNA1(Val) A37 N6-methylase TrmN6